jgi:hypothetical protein
MVSCGIEVASWYCPVWEFIKFWIPMMATFTFGYLVGIWWAERCRKKDEKLSSM